MSHKPYLVGIVGGSAAGKTSFLRDLVVRLPASSCSVVSEDNYYHPVARQERDGNGWPNFDLPTAIDRVRFHDDLCKLLRGETVVTTEYTYNQREKPGGLITVTPAQVLILEGLFLFHDDEIRTILDLRIFIDANEELCKQRRMLRDHRERGYPPDEVAYQWENHVMPAYRQYVLPYRKEAHFVVANHTSYAEGLDILAQQLMPRIMDSA